MTPQQLSQARVETIGEVKSSTGHVVGEVGKVIQGPWGPDPKETDTYIVEDFESGHHDKVVVEIAKFGCRGQISLEQIEPADHPEHIEDQRILKVVPQLLKLSHLTGGDININTVPVDIEVLKEVGFMYDQNSPNIMHIDAREPIYSARGF